MLDRKLEQSGSRIWRNSFGKLNIKYLENIVLGLAALWGGVFYFSLLLSLLATVLPGMSASASLKRRKMFSIGLSELNKATIILVSAVKFGVLSKILVHINYTTAPQGARKL